MSYNPTIASARRAAKQIARDTGAPYQASLDVVAQQAGRTDWNEYLASPAPLPNEEDKGMYIDGPEHGRNIKGIWITGLSTIPAALTLPFILRPSYPVSIGLTLEITALVLAMWLFGMGMTTMLSNMMAVHPQVPEVGREGTRFQYTVTDLTTTTMHLSLLALAGSYFTQDMPRANFPLVVVSAGTALVLVAAARLIEARMVRRVLALVAANGMTIAAFAALAGMLR